MTNETPKTPRTCDSCFACCVHLGIAELKKWPHTSCKHLDGSLGHSTRCSVYKTRPSACATYRCGWLDGLGLDDQRPDRAGFLITPYNERIPDAGFAITIMVFDMKLAGELSSGPLHDALETILNIGFRDIAIVFRGLNRGIHFLNGEIRTINVIQSKSPEELNFEALDPPLGRWELRDALERQALEKGLQS